MRFEPGFLRIITAKNIQVAKDGSILMLGPESSVTLSDEEGLEVSTKSEGTGCRLNHVILQGD
mgnify:CR=1 FL=1